MTVLLVRMLGSWLYADPAILWELRLGTEHWLGVLVLAPLVEEFLFREQIRAWMAARNGSPVLFGLLSAVLFAGTHRVFGDQAGVWPQLILGGSCWLVCQRLNWKYAVVNHALYNFFL